MNEHSLFGDARCGCRLSQPHHPVHEPEEKGSANREIDGIGWRIGELYPAPEQCLIGNRATNNYPYARIRTTRARARWLKLTRRGADCQVGDTLAAIKIGVARRTTTDNRGRD